MLKLKLIRIIILITPIAILLSSLYFYSHLEAIKLKAHTSSIFDLGVYTEEPDKNFKLKREDGLEIGASVYGTKEKVVKPGIILLHGHTTLGRMFPLYRVLSSKLAARGYIVLSIDLAGFGESGDPFQFYTVEALDKTKEVSAALSYLKSLRNLDKNKIYVVAHSGGTKTAIRFALMNEEIKKIVAIEPPRTRASVQERQYSWERLRKIRKSRYHKDFPEWYTMELHLRLNSDKYIDTYFDYFSREGHKPILLFNGELEEWKSKLILENFYTRIKEPKGYYVIKNSDHHLNVFEYKGIVFYNKKVINDLINHIDVWLGEGLVQ